MPPLFEELDYQQTPIGSISLRRRQLPQLSDEPVYEVRLGDEWLMSSLFTVVEIALANLGIAALGEATEGSQRVVVGGLGLGCTAAAALEHPSVSELVVVEYLQPVIGWHQAGLLPLGKTLCEDSRCVLKHGDFFALARGENGGFAGESSAAPDPSTSLWDAVLLDIDHSPDKLLNPSNATFYTHEGLLALAAQIRPQGIFAMWSDDPPDPVFMSTLGEIFEPPVAEVVRFDNPLRGDQSESTVYIARARDPQA